MILARRHLRVVLTAAVLLGRPAAALAQGYSPAEAAGHMTVPEELSVELFAAEPLVRQPVAMTFDERGRLWVIQYLQYPNPAGLKRIAVDRYSRTEYDRVPEPPPHGPRGADRITILEDTDADGRADRAKDFVDGLNLASGMLHGNGGIYVLQTPYLLFYADRDRDDVPDGDPEVLLSGFGMQDAHAVANSLAWGPDGWLYGAQGSTVTANIRGISFQQGIWRYHPRSRRFELFAEGGGNTWGLDFDRHGNLLAGTNVGGYALLNQVPGGYYWKSFGKHGELHNPHAFGYLEHVRYADFRGGHVTCGGIVYQGNSFPASFQNRYLAANLLSHAVYWHELEQRGSTFSARHGGELLVANDDWFAPVDVALAPDGAVFVADWHDQRTAHPDPDAQWDRTNGRIYRIQAKDARSLEPFDLAALSTAELIDQLASPSGWHRSTARRLLIERNDTAAVTRLTPGLAEPANLHRLEFLWTLNGMAEIQQPQLVALLADPDEYVRYWAVRSIGDAEQPNDPACRQLAELAHREPSAVVRSQLACTAQRLPAGETLPIVNGLLRHDADADDPQIPLLLWWALERHSAEPAPILTLLADSNLWQHRLLREHLIGRLARRWIVTGRPRDRAACAQLLSLAPTADDRLAIVQGLNAGLPGQHFAEPPEELAPAFNLLWAELPHPPAVVELGLRLGSAAAFEQATSVAVDSTRPEGARVASIKLLGETAATRSTTHLYKLLAASDEPEPIRQSALTALGSCEDARLGEKLLALYGDLPAPLRPRLLDLLASRTTTAHLLLDAIDREVLSPVDISLDHQRQLAAHSDPKLDAPITRIWGKVRAATPDERLAVVRRLNNDLRAASGDPYKGQLLFREHCGKCHELFGEGNKVGPELTAANRSDRDYLLVSLIDPSAQVRKEYLSHVVQTLDGRVLSGIVVEDSSAAITLVDAKNERHIVSKNEIEALEPAATSLMPEGQLEQLTPGQLRDLFSYLQAPAPLAAQTRQPPPTD